MHFNVKRFIGKVLLRAAVTLITDGGKVRNVLGDAATTEAMANAQAELRKINEMLQPVSDYMNRPKE